MNFHESLVCSIIEGKLANPNLTPDKKALADGTLALADYVVWRYSPETQVNGAGVAQSNGKGPHL